MMPLLRARLLASESFLWGWETEDVAGRRLESSWHDRWEAFHSPDEALCAGFVRFGARVGASAAADTPGREPPVPPVALVIVGWDSPRLLTSFAALFHRRENVQVLPDRRTRDRRQRAHVRSPERRRGERRAQPHVEAQIRTLGWSAVVRVGRRLLLTLPELTVRVAREPEGAGFSPAGN